MKASDKVTLMRFDDGYAGASAVLTLPLKQHWFELIRSGVKREEYRVPKGYWMKRLYKVYNYCRDHKPSRVVLRFSKGYTGQFIYVECVGHEQRGQIIIPPMSYKRHADWGEPDPKVCMRYLVLKLGDRLLNPTEAGAK